ncbi:hypothetical protein TNCV_5132371 [Trichonephila clavipes]|nr:hypothetical protein TNCV_5132371 [Trichonephila clavipes]
MHNKTFGLTRHNHFTSEAFQRLEEKIFHPSDLLNLPLQLKSLTILTISSKILREGNNSHLPRHESCVSVLEHFSDHDSIHQKMKKNTTSVRSYPNSAGDGKTPYEEGLVFFHLETAARYPVPGYVVINLKIHCGVLFPC